MNLPRFSVNNPVAANLLTVLAMVGGIVCWFTLLREFFPNIQAEKFTVTFAYPGVSPEDVEKNVARKVEQALDRVDDIEEIESRIVEGASVTTVTMEKNADIEKALNEIRSAVDRVKAELPDGVEEPEILEIRPFIPVIVVSVYGDVSEEKLREEARQVREDLLDLPDITRILVSGMRKREVWIEIDPEKLERFGLTHEEVGRTVAASNLDMPGGDLDTEFGSIRVRTIGEKDRIYDIEGIIVRSDFEGKAIFLRDIATVRETFEDRVERGRFAGKLAITLTIFKDPKQDALRIAKFAKEYVRQNPTRLGGVVHLSTSTDLSRFISQRLDLMLNNARSGFILVVLALAFFLDLRVALWVSSGLVISFFGTFVVMRFTGVSINLISLFGLIVVLGMLVDDAIVVGENVYTRMRSGVPAPRAAVEASGEVAMPVLGAVLTSVLAFIPLAFLEGQIGEMMSDLPVIVVAALTVSILEAFLILPAHLGHRRDLSRLAAMTPKFLRNGFQMVGSARTHLIEKIMPDAFEKILRPVLHWRYVTLALAFSFSIVVAGFVAGGILPFVLIQEVDAEYVDIQIEMTAGTHEDKTAEAISAIEKMALGFPEVATVFSIHGASYSAETGKVAAIDPAVVAQITIETVPADDRQKQGMMTCDQVVNALRKKAAEIPGLRKIRFITRSGGPEGSDIEIQVRGEELEEVARAVSEIRGEIQRYESIDSVEDDLNLGKREIRFHLRESARALGLTSADLALQIRHALYGFEAQEIQEEEEEVQVRVVLPEAARRSLSDLARLRIRTPQGRVPLEEVATLSTGQGYASLCRVDGKRAVRVSADVNEDKGNVAEITANLENRLASLGERFPGVALSFEGRKKETRESMNSLFIAFPIALLGIYAIIAILFKSYLQPVIVMVAIPYSFIGAAMGHLFMGYPVTFLSLIGGVALAGIVVNDSLVLVDFINRRRLEGAKTYDAVVQAARSRLRAILLTSITTILGILPLMFEDSFQAQFLIPMAISLVFGLTLATVLTLVLIPALYLCFEDFHNIVRWLVGTDGKSDSKG